MTFAAAAAVSAEFLSIFFTPAFTNKTYCHASSSSCPEPYILDPLPISFLQFQPKQLSRLCWALGAWHAQGVASLLPEAGLFAARALSEAGHRPKEYTAEELAQARADWFTLLLRSISIPGTLDAATRRFF